MIYTNYDDEENTEDLVYYSRDNGKQTRGGGWGGRGRGRGSA